MFFFFFGMLNINYIDLVFNKVKRDFFFFRFCIDFMISGNVVVRMKLYVY